MQLLNTLKILIILIINLKIIILDRNTVHTHLKNVHGINWAMYLDRIRKLRRGEEPAELPQIEMTECRVCNVNVKYLKDHLRYNNLIKNI